MRLKKAIAVFIAGAILIFLCLPLSVFAAGSVVMVNNSVLAADAGPETLNGVVMVPAQELAAGLGGSFSYSGSDMKGTLRTGENELVYRLDDSVASFDGKSIQADAPMKIVGMRFMVPAAFTARKLGAESYTHYTKGSLMIFQPNNGKLIYQVVSGDTLWIISRTFGVSISSIRQMNNLTSDMLYIGQKLIIKSMAPQVVSIAAKTISGATMMSGAGWNTVIKGYLKAGAEVTITGKSGEWYKVTTSSGNGYVYYTTVAATQDITAGATASSFFASNIPIDTSMDSVSYLSYKVVSGDSIWSIATQNGLQDYELAQANGVSPYAVLNPGQTIKIPVHTIPVKKTPDPKYGEVLDWFKEAQYVFPVGKTGKLTDIATGNSFMVKRTMGANHSDTETLTAQDSQIMKDTFGGSWIWTRRPFILEADGRRLAVSVAGMPHAGVDGAPYLQNVDNRSNNYGYGPNYDSIAGNGMDGHFDMYFLNCLRHVDNTIDAGHQYNVMAAGGLR